MKKIIYSKIKLLLISALVAFMTACSAYEEPLVDNAAALTTSKVNALPKSRSIANDDEQAKNEAIKKFAIILSKATYDHQEVRALLKDEASAYFDMNSDVLYALVKNESVGGRSFRTVLLEYISESELTDIEATVPLLNILVPKIPMFNISPENMDCSNKEIPVAFKGENGMELYINGQLEDVIGRGNLPAFHTIVVNENSRVKKVSEPGSRGDLDEGISFISPNYDARNSGTNASLDINYYDIDTGGYRAIQAFQYFKGYDNDKYSCALQRDFIYYGMTPDSERGSFNNAVREYLISFKVNPRSFFNISDQTTGENYADPSLVKNSVERHKKAKDLNELIEEMWSKGSYNFRFEVIYSNGSLPSTVYIPLYPHELWDFNISETFEKGGLFHRDSYYYKIDPTKFTAKRVLLDKKIPLDKWDLSSEGLERYIRIFEEDKSQTYKESWEFDVTKMNSTKISGSVKIGLGTDIVSGNVSTESSSSTTTKNARKVEITRQEEDDALGTIKVYFYDPIVEAQYGLQQFILHEYTTGVVSFTLTADYM